MDLIIYLGSALGLSFVSGVNLYATVLTIGLGVRFGLIQLHPGIADLSILSNPYVLIIAGVFYVAEFIADKIPWFDSVWDVFHTIIRPLGAAIIQATAIANVDPFTKIIAIMLCGGVALSSHSTKAGTRVAINHSPEPFSNIVMSLIEDGFVIGGTWLAVNHPIITFIFLIIFLLLFFWLVPKIYRLIYVEFVATWALLKQLFNWLLLPLQARLMQNSLGRTIVVSAETDKVSLVGFIPDSYLGYLHREFSINLVDLKMAIRVVAGKGLPKLRNSICYVCVDNKERLFLIARKLFRYRRVDLSGAHDFSFRAGWFMDSIGWQSEKGQRQTIFLFKNIANQGEEIIRILTKSKAAYNNTIEK